MKRFSAWIGSLGSFAAALALASPSLADTEEPPTVIGGVATKACGFPSTVSFGGWGSCSGTLIHPKVVTSAAHCLMGSTATALEQMGRGGDVAGGLTHCDRLEDQMRELGDRLGRVAQKVAV